MPDIADQAIEPEAADQVAPDEQSPLLGGKLKLCGFAVVVVVLECLAAYLFIPAARDVAGMEVISPNPVSDSGPPIELDEQKQQERVDLVEVDLGEFTVTSYQPISATTLRIDFHLFATVTSEDKQDFDLGMQSSLHRIRDQVIEIVRSSELEDVTDAGLGLIKRKILEKTNHSLGRPFLQTVVFSDFSFIEQ